MNEPDDWTEGADSDSLERNALGCVLVISLVVFFTCVAVIAWRFS